MKGACLFVATALSCPRAASAFVVSNSNNAVGTGLEMIGGRGWDNQDYLSSLSGDDEDREKSREDYQEFSDRRAAFNKRQEEIMKTPQGQAFMKQRQEQQFRNLQEEEQNPFSEEGLPFEDFQEGSGGGTRMSRMMAQAKRMQGRPGGRNMMVGGMQQQLLGPLDDEEEEEEI